MRRYFTKTFYKFLAVFLIIIALSFVVLAIVAQESPRPVDNMAQPQ